MQKDAVLVTLLSYETFIQSQNLIRYNLNCFIKNILQQKNDNDFTMSAGWLKIQEFTGDIDFIFSIGIMPL